jgi:hypothetical protein
MSADVFAEDGYYAVVPEWVLDADISAQAVRLYAVLRRYADHRSREAHPSRKTLAGRLHVVDLKVIDRALDDLKRIGAVEVFERYTPAGDRDSNGYLIKARGQLSSQGGGRNLPTGGGADARGVGVETPQQEPQPMNHSQLNQSGRATRIPEDWQPTDEQRAYAQERGIVGSRLDDVAANFRDHWLNKPGKDGRKLDWGRAWQTWVRNEAKWNGARTAPAPVVERPVYRSAEESRAAREAYEAAELKRLQEHYARKAAQA